MLALLKQQLLFLAHDRTRQLLPRPLGIVWLSTSGRVSRSLFLHTPTSPFPGMPRGETPDWFPECHRATGVPTLSQKSLLYSGPSILWQLERGFQCQTGVGGRSAFRDAEQTQGEGSQTPQGMTYALTSQIISSGLNASLLPGPFENYE